MMMVTMVTMAHSIIQTMMVTAMAMMLQAAPQIPVATSRMTLIAMMEMQASIPVKEKFAEIMWMKIAMALFRNAG